MKRKWDYKDQAVWDAMTANIRALKIIGWLSLKEHEEILAFLQKCIENKED